jgi:23S rRNA (cytosine1962-C5)-methyltransferase
VQPPFDPAWIIALTPDYVAVDKPAGMATQAQEEGLEDDLTSRLRAFLRARGEHDALGIHQRLDRETSGVVLYSRGGALGGAIGRAFEERRVRKEYVAGVFGNPGAARTLRHSLTERSRGVVRVVPRGGKEAVTEFETIERRGDRALLALRPLTGRTHQLRVQLAEIGCPIAGDSLYGDRPASRMLLHASRLVVALEDGAEMRFDSPLPPELARFVRGEDGVPIDDEAALDAALARALHRRGALLFPPSGRAGTDAFRLVHRHGDGIPELAVDRYGEHLVLHAYEDDGPIALDAAVSALSKLDCRGIYLKRRRRVTHETMDVTSDELAPPEPIWGEAAPFEFDVQEHSVSYPVRLGDGLSTGLFLDQRENRRRLRETIGQGSLLNLFGYAGAFTVAAVSGGARHTLTVDASKSAIERARERVLGREPEGEHRFLVEDVFALLPRLARRGERFDHVVVDPPTHARTKKNRFNSGKDWVELAAQCAGLVTEGGTLWASSNDHRMDVETFERYLRRGTDAAGRKVGSRRVYGPPIDFPHTPGLPPHQKLVLLELR